jgi:hypothetical protein
MFGGISHKIVSRSASSYTGGGTVQQGIYLHGIITGSRTNSYTLPEDCQVNDILVFWASGAVGPYSWGGSGFTNLLTRGSDGTYPGCAFGVRRLTSGFSTTFTVGDGRYSTVIGVFRNVTTGTMPPRDGTVNHTQAIGFSSAPNPPAYTTTVGVGTALIACVCLTQYQNKSTVVAPLGYTLVAAEDGTGDGRTETVAMAYKILSSSGSENPNAFSGFGGSSYWLAECTSLLAAT